MKIFIDADACPQVLKQILFKAAVRTNHQLILVANKYIYIPREPLIKMVCVDNTPDSADNYIAEHVGVDDLVITSDIPLADRVIEKHAVALNSHGEFFTKENIKERLSTRDFLHNLRSSGVITGGSKPLDKKDVAAFANALDRYLAKF